MLRLIAEGVPPSHGNVVGQTGVRKKKWILIADKDPLVFDVLTLLYLSFHHFHYLQLHIAALWGNGKS